VLWLAKGLGPGGMERLLVNHARFGDHDRFRYLAAHLVERPHSLVGELEAAGVECRRLGSGSGRDVSWLAELRRWVATAGVRVVHGHSPLPMAMARPVLRTMRPRPALVYTEHNSWDCYGTATRTLNLLTYPLDDCQLAVSAAAAASPPARLARRVEVLVHGIDLEAVRAHAASRSRARAELGLGAEDLAVVAVANLRVEKAYDVMLDAAARVVARSPRVRFLSVGQGPLQDELTARHRELGLGDRFRFLGFRDDVADVLAAADVFLLSSRQEGLPLSYMESAALGVPAVVTAVGGLPDVVGADCGIVVPPEDPAALADAVLRLADDPTLLAELAAGAAAGADRFDARRAVAHQEACYLGAVR